MSTPNRPTKADRKAQARAEREEAARAAAAGAARKRRLAQLGAVLGAAVVVVIVAVVVSSGGGDDKPVAKAGEAVAGQTLMREMLDGIPQKGISLGNEDAPVTVVEFGDLQCPVCKSFANDNLPPIIQDYVRTGKVKMEFRTLSFLGEDSVKAGRAAAVAAQSDKLWDFVDLWYRNQGEENSGYATDEFIKEIGSGVAGLDTAKLISDRDDAAAIKALSDSDALATETGVNSTPSFLVGPTGGKLEKTDRPYTELADVLKDAVADASGGAAAGN